MNLKQWAQREGVHPLTAYRWFREGRLPVPRAAGGPADPGRAGRRVAAAHRADGRVRAGVLSRPATGPAPAGRPGHTTWLTGEGGQVDRVVTEVGSALNGKRRKFLALLRDPTVARIVVEHRDRFARFGAEYVEAALAAQGRELVVVDPAEVDDDLVCDVTEILTSLCARLYGRRAAANRASRAVAAATADPS